MQTMLGFRPVKNNKKRLSKALVAVSAAWLLHVSPVFSQAAKHHPYLYFSPDKVAQMKERAKTDTSIANSWGYILKEADNLLVKGDARDKIDYLSLAYVATNDKKYAEKVKEVLLKLCTQATWSNAEMLQRNPPWTSDLRTAHYCWTVAIGYDAIYDFLSKEDRKTIVDGVVRMGIKPALDEWFFPETRIHTLNSMGHNWWSACVDMAGIACLAIANDYKPAEEWADQVAKSAEEWWGFNGDQLQYKPKSFDKDGGMYESVNYAAFGIGEYLFFRLAYANTFPGKKQPDIEVLKNVANFFLQVSYPRTGPVFSLDFGDHHHTTAADRPVKLLQALGYTSPNNLWYLNQVVGIQHREGLSARTPIGLVYQPDMGQAPKVPNLPTSALFEDMDWASMRSSWEKDATMLGIKSGYTWNHSHADANSFILFHKGEEIIKDAGTVYYGSKDYPDYFFQSQAHNVVLFNGKAQPKEQQYSGSPLRGEVSGLMDVGDIKYVLANGVGPTSAYFNRNFRHFLWLGKVILIIDDVKAHETGKFQWLLHPGGESKKTGGDISISKEKSAVLVRPLFPETLVQTGFNHDFPEKMQLTELTAPKARDTEHPTEMYYSIEYPQEVKQTKFVTAIILKDSLNDKNLPVIERLHSETMQGLRIKQDGKVTEIYLNLLADGRIMHLNSCASFNGWDTDAYLFGFSYPENKKDFKTEDVKDLMLVYGSYIRREGKTLFNSLSKLDMIARKEGEKLNVALTGQPVINASLYAGKKPAQLQLNGKAAAPVYNAETKTIRIEINQNK